MAAFRLKMATQLGEKIAAEFGYRQFPIDPLAIARAKNISIYPKKPEMKGISGALIFEGDQVSLTFSTEYNNVGFEHFCVAHELGHYFLPGHLEEIIKSGGAHISRANFTEATSIELEADHFASGLLMPSALTRALLSKSEIGLEGIFGLADQAQCSRTSAAIRAAECSAYPVAIVVSHGDKIAYAFLSDTFKNLGKLAFLRKGSALPVSLTRSFNADPHNVSGTRQACGETNLADWFDGPRKVLLDEQVVGLGAYGYTLTVLTSEELTEESDEEDDEDTQLEQSWTPRFAYGR